MEPLRRSPFPFGHVRQVRFHREILLLLELLATTPFRRARNVWSHFVAVRFPSVMYGKYAFIGKYSFSPVLLTAKLGG